MTPRTSHPTVHPPKARRSRRPRPSAAAARTACALAATAGLGAALAAAPASAAVRATAAASQDGVYAQLGASLDLAPGMPAARVQALIADLKALAAGTQPASLAADLEGVVAKLAADAGVPGVLTTVESLLGGLPGVADIEGIIAELQSLAAADGVPPIVSAAAGQLAAALTNADLGALLGQAGSPLTAAQIQEILAELATLQGLEPGQAVPAGLLSGVGGALDSVASQPGVPAAVAGALESVAGTLDSSGSLPPAAIGSVVPTLQETVPALNSVPAGGPALGSVVGTLATELGSSPAAGGGTSGGSAGAGGSGATGAQTAPASVQSARFRAGGARIRSLAYAGGRLHVKLACPVLHNGACVTTVHLAVGAWTTSLKKVTIRAGRTRTVVGRLPKLAVTARTRKVTVTVTATTGTFRTHKHRVQVRVAK